MTTGIVDFDLLGRIQALDPGAEALFGHSAAQVLEKERISLLINGRVVLQQLPGWLAAASKEGSWEGDALCRHRDGRKLPCHLRITPLLEGDRPVGFQQQATLLEGVEVASLELPSNPGSELGRWAAITRLPFVTASLAPVALGLALAAWAGQPLGWIPGILALLATLLLHLGANVSNDWYDRRSGTDALNLDYVAPFSGGSRVVELGLVSERGQLIAMIVTFALGALAGLVLVLGWAPGLLWVGLAGAFLGFCYTAPPLRLVARRGLGELSIFLAFGPLLTLAGYAASGAPLSWSAALVGVPAGLWTTGILWVNQIPDVAGDRAAGKWNLVASIGRKHAASHLPVVLGLGHLATILLVVAGLLPALALVSLLPLALVVKGAKIAREHAEDDGIIGACAATVQHQLAAGVLQVVMVALAAWSG